MKCKGDKGTEGRVRARKIDRAWGLATALGAILSILAASAGPAGAATSGQIEEAWGKAGSAEGLFHDPAMLGVDPSDGSVYSGEEKDETHYRLQKFTSGGEIKASVEIPRFIKEGEEEKLITLHGMAVDPVLHRLYVIEGCRLQMPATDCETIWPTFGARRILVFSTEPSGSTLEPATPATLSLPGGEEAIYNPQTIAVDPSSHDLVILGDDIKEHLVIQRVGSDGVAGARYVDTGDELRQPGKEAESLAVGPDGTTYTLTGGPSRAGAQNTRAWQLPPSLAYVEPVPGFAEAAKSEGWTTGLLTPKTSTFMGGPQLAVSPDGDTLYWKESISLGEEDSDPSNVLVRGFSLSEDATKVLYGNGLNSGKKRCLIQTPEAGIATVGENLVVFDYGPGEESTAFGNRVMTFGPGGTECRSPVAKFTINGKGEAEEVSVEKGTQVTFDSTSSELIGLSANELDWEFGDGNEEKVTGSPPAKTVKHTFASAGTYRVTLRMKLTQSETANFGDPLPVTRLIKVTGGGALNQLTVSRAGSGWGSVTSSPAGIACGPDCDQEYEAGKEVTLTAKASSGSKFAGWSGDCSGTGTCKVTMSEAKAVTATFEPVAKKKLTVQKGGSGLGTVTSAPSGIDCRNDCEQEFEEGKVVTLTALSVPGTNSKFGGWSGACAGSENPCMVTMNEAKTVTATFTSSGTQKLEVQFVGDGTGRVASIPVGINCTTNCSGVFDKGKEVELVREETGGSSFVKWGEACSGAGTCKVTLSEDKVVTAEFTNPGPFKLSVAKIGSGAGTVTGTGINCPGDCEETIEKNLEATLTATPGENSKFVKWGGDCSGSESTCKVTMSKARSVTAEFESTVVPGVKLKVKVVGPGQVTGTGIGCPGDCEEEFPKETEVSLAAAADVEAEFVKWTGACTGSGACKVKLSAPKEVTAEFKAKPKFKLTVKKVGTGLGKVTSSPAGVDCGGTCEVEFESGVAVELSQSADSGSEFVRWLGGCAGSGACKVTMSAAKTVTAEFKVVSTGGGGGGGGSTGGGGGTGTGGGSTGGGGGTTQPKRPTLKQEIAKCKKKKNKKARAKCIKKAKLKFRHKKRESRRAREAARSKDGG